MLLRWDGPEQIVETEIARCLSDPERAAVGFLSAKVSSKCERSRGKLSCPLTEAIGLGEQCGAEHKGLVDAWLGPDGVPSRCAEVPDTAFNQAVYNEVAVETKGDRVIVDDSGTGTDGPDSKTWSWKERFEFQRVGSSLKLVSKTATGSPRRY